MAEAGAAPGAMPEALEIALIQVLTPPPERGFCRKGQEVRRPRTTTDGGWGPAAPLGPLRRAAHAATTSTRSHGGHPSPFLRPTPCRLDWRRTALYWRD